jgi:3-hydroxyisobutyrate dehydrogenase-like beta-hydroxyacid dehydrogenase
MPDTPTIGLIGLGAMGLPMGRRFLAAGRDLLVVPHRNAAPAEELRALGARVVAAANELRDQCDFVVASLPDVPQVQEVLFGERGLAQARRPPARTSLFIDMSTINPSAAQEHAKRLAEVGIAALDAPVSGGPMRAADGTLTMMVGGDTASFGEGKAVLADVGSSIVHVGGAGAGQALKLVNQLLISIVMVANAEALTLGVKAGLPLETMLEVISTSSGSNYLMRDWMPRTLFTGDLTGGFALELLQKDLNAALSWAKDMGVPMFGGSLAQQLYRIEQAKGAGRSDYSTVARIYEEVAGVKLRLGEDGRK